VRVLEEEKGELLGEVLVAIKVFTVFREYDNWPAFLGGRMKGLKCS